MTYMNETSKWKMLLYLVLIQFIIAFVARSIAPLAILIGEDLSLTAAQIGMFPSALFLGQSIVSIPSGMLVDKLGSRYMMLVIIIMLSSAFFLLSMTKTFPFTLLLIIVAGIAYGASHPTTNRGIVYWFPLKDRGTAMGIKQTGVTVGSACSALILLPIANNFGWKVAVSYAALSLLMIGLILYKLYYEPKDFLEGSKVKNEKHTFRVVITLFKNKILLLITICAMMLSGSQMILNTFIILYAHHELQISLILAGSLLIIAEIGGSAGRIVWGIVSDKIFKGNRIIVLLLISIFVALTSSSISFLTENVSFYLLATIVFLFGFSVSGFNGVWMNATTEIVDKKLAGISTGISITFGSLGVVFLPPIFGKIIDVTNDYTYGWLFVTSLMLITSLLCWYMLKQKR